MVLADPYFVPLQQICRFLARFYYLHEKSGSLKIPQQIHTLLAKVDKIKESMNKAQKKDWFTPLDCPRNPSVHGKTKFQILSKAEQRKFRKLNTEAPWISEIVYIK